MYGMGGRRGPGMGYCPGMGFRPMRVHRRPMAGLFILPALVFGGKGGIAGCANVFPRTMVEIYEAFIAGDMERAKKVQDSIRVFRNCFKFGNPNTIVKLAAGLLGDPVGPCRKPFCKITDQGMTELKRTLEVCKLNGLH